MGFIRNVEDRNGFFIFRVVKAIEKFIFAKYNANGVFRDGFKTIQRDITDISISVFIVEFTSNKLLVVQLSATNCFSINFATNSWVCRTFLL
jgi:hypothetical protein